MIRTRKFPLDMPHLESIIVKVKIFSLTAPLRRRDRRERPPANVLR
jgi:hypothetical protein